MNDGVLERVVRARGAESGVLRVVVLGISTLGMAATLPGQTAGVSLFIDAFIEDLGLSRSLVSWFYTVATVLSSLGLPLVGRLVDRYGPRRMAVAVIALFAASCAGMSQVSGIPDVDVLALYGGVFGIAGDDAAGPPRQRLRLLLRTRTPRHHPRPGERRLYWRHSDWFIGGTAIGPAVLAMGPDFMGASRQSCGSVRRFRSCWPSPRSWGGRRSRREE